MNIEKQLIQYLKEVLGATALRIEACPQTTSLPYYLQDAFQYRQVSLAGQMVILALKSGQDKQALRDVRGQLARVGELLKSPVVYCLPAYERRNLIEQKVPFIVPGNQMYLPELGIDLREYFRDNASNQNAQFSPSTQALLIWYLLHVPENIEWSPSEITANLGYTPMTATRAIRELVGAGLAEVISVGRNKHLRMTQAKAAIWEKAKPLMRTPIKRVVWIHENTGLDNAHTRLAGLTGLAQHTILSAPRDRCVAITADKWREAKEGGVRELPEPETGAYQLQIWSYSPVLQANSKTVDFLSLLLSLKDSADDRVQMAMDELQEQLPWLKD
jgi:DNA-binding MarR family transcriptional regulator